MITMKYRTLALALVAALLVGLGAGCTTRSTIDAASTKMAATMGDGKTLELVLPKELETTGFRAEIDPATGKVVITADQLRSSSQGIIQSAGAAQADAMARMAGLMERLAAVALPIPPPATSPPAAASAAP